MWTVCLLVNGGVISFSVPCICGKTRLTRLCATVPTMADYQGLVGLCAACLYACRRLCPLRIGSALTWTPPIMLGRPGPPAVPFPFISCRLLYLPLMDAAAAGWAVRLAPLLVAHVRTDAPSPATLRVPPTPTNLVQRRFRLCTFVLSFCGFYVEVFIHLTCAIGS